MLLLQRGPDAPWLPGRWNLPGGAIEPDESPLDAATREVREEAGLRGRGLILVKTVLTRGDPHHIFSARYWSGKVKLDFEHADYQGVSREKLDQFEVVPTQRAALARFHAPAKPEQVWEDQVRKSMCI